MKVPRLLHPEDIDKILQRKYKVHQSAWLIGEGHWPLQINLGSPNENFVMLQPDLIQTWIISWQRFPAANHLIWRQRQFRVFGVQQLPYKLIFANPVAVVSFINQSQNWSQAISRFQELTQLWPNLKTRFKKYFYLLTEFSDQEISKFKTLLLWLEKNPSSNLYPRQLPIAGIDTKWLEQHKAIIHHFLTIIYGIDESSFDFWQHCGLKQLPITLRIRWLDPELRKQFQNIGDMTISLQDIAQLRLPIAKVYIIENTQTGLAFHDIANAILIMGLGYSVDILKKISWLDQCECFYWGDIDTHGFAILSRARIHLPHLKSLLMDDATLQAHQQLIVSETSPNSRDELPNLTDSEQIVYAGLKQQRWGQNIRLEQERIAWNYAWPIIAKTIA
jgi:hypothetical protein